jgi:hypothetical protein
VRNLNYRNKLPLALALACALGSRPASAEPGSPMDQVLDAVVAHEVEVAAALEQYRPLVETYVQTVRPDSAVGYVPVKDNYFFGRLELPGDPAAADSKGNTKKNKNTLSLFDDYHSQTFQPEAFARMLIIDRGEFDRAHYDFEFVRSEFLGEIRALVFDVIPKSGKALNPLRTARFTGRIWVEDQDYHVVRYNGVYSSAMSDSLHFDSWRLNMAAGLWLPAYVYTEAPDAAFRQQRLMHRGQTRIWGYSIKRKNGDDEFTKVLVDSPQANDGSDRPGQVSPVESMRAWEGEAEENVIQRLERAALIAPQGEVDKVLETVVTNLEITNSLDVQPPVRCRVLLTTPLESFTVGHTIVLSRGLIDVLPDEASLAMVLAHELGHVLSGHRLDTRFAFTDQILIGDRETLKRFPFERPLAEEQEADNRAMALLQNSPYKDTLGNAGLFLRALSVKAGDMPALLRPHFGNPLADTNRLYRMAGMLGAAPALDPTSMDQTAALPLGGRVRLDPWSARCELMDSARTGLLTVREKMPFQVTPLMPYLARFGTRSDGTSGAVARKRSAPLPRAEEAGGSR